MHSRFVLSAMLVAVAAGSARAEISLEKVTIVAGNGDEFRVPAQVLAEEVELRTGIAWPLAESGRQGAIAFRPAGANDNVGEEGFQIATQPGNSPQITISATGRRGALFAVGYLLRQLDCSKGRVSLPNALDVTQQPEYAIRGHQLGYRAQANSYDGWDEKLFDRYIRELALFGTNAIENIPFQDERPTPIMPLGRAEMNRVMSAVCDKYDVDYWVWTPADFDLTDAEKRTAGLKFHEQFYTECPRLDAIFFPGGDPGDNHPRDVLPYLADLSVILAQHHPQAKIWMSLQGFEGDKTDFVFDWLSEHQPDWLGGLVAGPSSPPLPDLRARLDRKYQLRDYPDITHVVRCQYPELNLDQVWALTAGREPINPRPLFYADVFAGTAPHTNGFISYSDGCHDDVNKILWSGLAWDSKQQPRDILVEYARCYFGSQDAESVADGILALEQNWNGALRANAGVAATLEQWQTLESAHPELKDNWRWQMLLTRAYYDAYQQLRLARETEQEQQAYAELDPQQNPLPTDAMHAALAVLSRAQSDPVSPDVRNRLFELFADLYDNVRFQSSVEKYHAIHPQRGCMLDFMDYPLNNRFWLEDEFEKVLTLPTLEARWARLDELKNWETPGAGSCYDDIGCVGRSPHVTRSSDSDGTAGSYWWVDNGMSRQRLSWLVTGSPAALVYDVDPQAKYVLRFSGFGELKPRANGRPLTATKYETAMNTLKEFPVPPELLEDGKLSVTFDNVHLDGVNWRYQPRLAEAWLLKQP